MSRKQRIRQSQAKRYEFVNGLIGSAWEFGVPVAFMLQDAWTWTLRITLSMVWIVIIGPLGYRLLPKILNPVFDLVLGIFRRDLD